MTALPTTVPRNMNAALVRDFQEKTITAQQAAALIHSGQKVFIGYCTSYARTLADALAARSHELENVTVGCANIIPPMSFLDCENPDAFRTATFFLGYEDRRALRLGRADYTSFHLSQVDQWCFQTFRPDVVFLDVSYPDENGYMSFGASGCCMDTYLREAAQTIVLQVNRHSPYIFGEQTRIHISEADFIVWSDVEKETIPGGPMEPDAETEAIAHYLLDQIPDGACIQLGIGGVANAVGYGLRQKNDLGCHTEMVTDSIMALMKEGVITNRRPKFIPNRTVAGFAFGSTALYDFLNYNEDIFFAPFPLINDPRSIAQNDNMISINTVMSMDLFGQVAAEGMGGQQYSAVGGQLDYVRGAQMAKNGKSFLAFKSTLGPGPDGKPKSRIVPSFPPNTIVTTPRSDVQYVATEYGVVNLKPLNARDKAHALIQLAHPACRPDLIQAAKEWGLW